MDWHIARSARKHGTSEEDIEHALDHWIYSHDIGEGFAMFVGPATNAALLEVGLVTIAGDTHVVHAMPARSKYLRGR
ncbi:MAG: hypothetical protein EPO52_06675 [Herbiconiux sp.]|uniref:hypothetical protein n=1 Tax=Herbiconiux sp. TaxID=1871186 RepID=UPI0011FB7F35|nr:hypothetical protein [Herbiconiux sp.]TAJ47878.1 MAG: hypothetical protein EPO52_06675 [Herbiconiux sp.]